MSDTPQLPDTRRVINAVLEAIEGYRISTGRGAEVVQEWMEGGRGLSVSEYLAAFDLYTTLDTAAPATAEPTAEAVRKALRYILIEEHGGQPMKRLAEAVGLGAEYNGPWVPLCDRIVDRILSLSRGSGPVGQASERLLQEKYWCGCVREARWTRCERHTHFGHSEEPQTANIEAERAASAEAKRVEITDAMVERAIAGWLEEINRSHAAGETEAEWSRRDTVRAILLAALSPERGG